MSDFEKSYRDYYADIISNLEATELIKHRVLLENLLSIEFFYDSLLVDEACILLDMLVDECFVRLSKLSACD